MKRSQNAKGCLMKLRFVLKSTWETKDSSNKVRGAALWNRHYFKIVINKLKYLTGVTGINKQNNETDETSRKETHRRMATSSETELKVGFSLHGVKAIHLHLFWPWLFWPNTKINTWWIRDSLEKAKKKIFLQQRRRTWWLHCREGSFR